MFVVRFKAIYQHTANAQHSTEAERSSRTARRVCSALFEVGSLDMEGCSIRLHRFSLSLQIDIAWSPSRSPVLLQGPESVALHFTSSTDKHT